MIRGCLPAVYQPFTRQPRRKNLSGEDYLLCGPWEPPGPEGRGEEDGRDGAAAGGEDGLLGALADGGGEEGLETDGGLLGRFMPE